MGGGKGGVVGAIGNFSIQYNLTSASIALAVLSKESNGPEKPDWSRYLLLSVVFFGCALGMLIMGRLGDILGRAKALAVVKGKVVPDKLEFLKLLQGKSSAKFWRRKKLRRCCAEAARRLN